MARCPDQPARSTAAGCGRVELGSHVRLLILQLLEEVAWLSRSPEGRGGEDTEFLRKGTWFTADPKASSPCYSKHGPDLEGLVRNAESQTPPQAPGIRSAEEMILLLRLEERCLRTAVQWVCGDGVELLEGRSWQVTTLGGWKRQPGAGCQGAR